MSATTKKNILHTLIFAAFVFTYTIMLPVMDHATTASSAVLHANLDENTRVILHYLPNVTRVIGFISFALSRRLLTEPKARKVLLLIISILFVSSVIIITVEPSALLTMISVFILAFSLGHLGGLMYYMMAAYMAANPCSGRLTAIALSLSILVQFILSRFTGDVGNVIVAVVLWFILMYIAFRPPDDYVLENPLPYATDTDNWTHSVRKQLILACIILFLATILAIRTDMAFVSMQLSETIDIYSYPRLFIIPGYLLLGFAADSRRKNAFSALFFAGMLLAFPIGLVASAKSGYMALMSIYYFYAAFYIFFFIFVFQKLAPKTKHPEFWASAGRFISETCTLVTSLIILRLNIGADETSIIVTSLVTAALVGLIFLCISMMGFEPAISPEPEVSESVVTATDNTVSDAEETNTAGSTPSQPADLDAFLSEYPLTPREKEIATILLSTDLTIKAIASDLSLSERSVFRYAASVYEKTGTGTRVGLMQTYMKGK